MQRWAPSGRFLVGITVIAALLVLGPIKWFSPDQQSAWASSFQAIGLVAALFFAAATLASDRQDRRVDRVLAFHEELTAGPTGEARSRLARLLGDKGQSKDEALQVRREQLRDDATLNVYPSHEDAQVGTPSHDLVRVLRLFERIRGAHEAGTLDDKLVATLLGRHVGWWDLAIARSDNATRVPLTKLAEWTEQYATAHQHDPGFENWGKSRAKAFPRGPIDEVVPAVADAQPPTPSEPAETPEPKDEPTT